MTIGNAATAPHFALVYLSVHAAHLDEVIGRIQRLSDQYHAGGEILIKPHCVSTKRRLYDVIVECDFPVRDTTGADLPPWDELRRMLAGDGLIAA